MKDSNQFTENTVAFIDVLGFTSLVDMAVEAEDPSFLIKHINKAISETFNSIKNIKHDSISVKMFSDNISISTDNSPPNILFLFRIASKIQLTLFMSDIRVRGAISIGKHYENENIIFSKALIKAYNLEKKHAIYPRIVIDREILNRFPGYDIEPFKSYCLKDSDGFYIVDYLGSIIYLFEHDQDTTIKTILLHTLERHKYYIEEYRSEILNNSDIGKKLLWAAYYHNTKLSNSSLTDEEKERLKIDNLPRCF